MACTHRGEARRGSHIGNRTSPCLLNLFIKSTSYPTYIALHCRYFETNHSIKFKISVCFISWFESFIERFKMSRFLYLVVVVNGPLFRWLIRIFD